MPLNVPLLRASWSLVDGIWGVLKGSWGVLDNDNNNGSLGVEGSAWQQGSFVTLRPANDLDAKLYRSRLRAVAEDERKSSENKGVHKASFPIDLSDLELPIPLS